MGLTIAGLVSLYVSRQPVPVKTLLVLPFENRGGAENERWCEGVRETVTGILGGAPELKPDYVVVPYSEVQKLNVRTKLEALRKMGANLVISGTVRTTATELQIGLVLTSTWRMRDLDSRVVAVPRDIAPAELKKVLAGNLGAMLIRRPLTVSGS